MKPQSIVIVGLIFVVAIFLGFFSVGSHFLHKNQEYAEQRFEKQTQDAEARRGEKVASAKDANADDFQIKALRDRMEKAVYEKKSSYRDLEKIIKKSKRGMKLWYAAETDEDAEQAKLYLEKYKDLADALAARRQEKEKEADKCDAKFAALRECSRKLSERMSALEARADALSRKVSRALEQYNKTQGELEATPTFKKGPVEKKLRAQEREIKTQKATAQKLLGAVEKLKEEIDETDFAMRSSQERGISLRDEILELLQEEKLCRDAYAKTASVLKCVGEIQTLKAEIRKFEASREDKKIEAYL